MRTFITLFLLTSVVLTHAQGNQVELPYENGEVVFRNHINKEAGKAELFEQLIKLVNADRDLSDVKIDRKTFSITAKGLMLVPTKRSKDEITYSFYAVAGENEVNFIYRNFYHVEIGQSLEKLIEMNKDSERQTVKENLKFIKLGVHTDINAHVRAVKSHFRGN